MGNTIVFYTTATGRYEHFIPLYTYFVSRSNPGAKFEYVVDDAAAARAHFADTLAWFEAQGISVVLRSASESKHTPSMANTLRFVLPCQTKADYIYIGDVDIFIVEDVMAAHRKVFEAGFPFSNIVRDGTKKLSGLHFSRWDAYYPLPEIADILAETHNDEEVLYKIVERKIGLDAVADIRAVGVGRPAHGIHMSFNRMPFSYSKTVPDWSLTYPFCVKTLEIADGPDYSAFVASLPEGARMLLANVYLIAKGTLAVGREEFEYLSGRSKPAPNTTVARSASTAQADNPFSKIYDENKWRGSESQSGPSSSLARTATLRAGLAEFIEKFDVSSILDLPCGDFNWMKHFLAERDIRYIGGDIVDFVIASNKTKASSTAAQLENKRIRFEVIDLRQDPLPSSDLLICRDCLFHLSYKDIALAARNIAASDIKYVGVTTHKNSGFQNKDITTGDWRWFDLFLPPFNLAQDYIARIEDGGGDRYFCIWKREDFARAVAPYVAAQLGAEAAH